MSTNVFLVWAPESTVPLTVFAPSSEAAVETYTLWAAIHMPTWSHEPIRVQEVAPEWLGDRPQLEAAARRASHTGMHDAVLLFRDHVAGWIAVPAYAERVGAIAPVEPRVRSFEVRVQMDDRWNLAVMVFAESIEEAVQLYIDHCELNGGRVDHAYRVTEFSRWQLGGERRVLREQMDLGMTGVAGWSSERGWAIYPPGHELAGL